MYNMIETKTNSHYLLGNGTACNPLKLPKGTLAVEGEAYTYQANGETRTATHRVLCNKCNRVR